MYAIRMYFFFGTSDWEAGDLLLVSWTGSTKMNNKKSVELKK